MRADCCRRKAAAAGTRDGSRRFEDVAALDLAPLQNCRLLPDTAEIHIRRDRRRARDSSDSSAASRERAVLRESPRAVALDRLRGAPEKIVVWKRHDTAPGVDGCAPRLVAVLKRRGERPSARALGSAAKVTGWRLSGSVAGLALEIAQLFAREIEWRGACGRVRGRMTLMPASPSSRREWRRSPRHPRDDDVRSLRRPWLRNYRHGTDFPAKPWNAPEPIIDPRVEGLPGSYQA